MAETEFDLGALLEGMFEKPSFQQAWRDVGDVGLESKEAITRAWTLLTTSPRHGKKLADITNQLTKAAGEWACSIDWAAVDAMHGDNGNAPHAFDEAAFQTFQWEVAQTTSTIAACYLLIGVLVGVLTAAETDES